MSKLIDKLKQSSNITPSPMGFGRAAAAPPKPRMALVAGLTAAQAGSAAELINGADAALWRMTGKEKAPAKAPADIPWGCWMRDAGKAEMESAAKANDFIIFTLGAYLSVPAEKAVTGYILQIDPDFPDSLLRGLSEAPASGYLVTSKAQSSLTWQDLLTYQRVCAAVNKPLLAAVPAGLSVNELQALWDMGFDGVVVDAVDGKSVIADMRAELDKLTKPQRKKSRTEVFLPRMAAPAEESHSEPEPDEGDEDDE